MTHIHSLKVPCIHYLHDFERKQGIRLSLKLAEEDEGRFFEVVVYRMFGKKEKCIWSGKVN